MKKVLMHMLSAATLAVLFSAAGAPAYAAEPLVLSDAQLDSVTAGAQYSLVYGEAFAESGTVRVNTRVSTKERANGTQMTKGVVTVYARGTGLEALAYGESGIDDALLGLLATASTDSGRIRIRLVTMTVVKANGDSMIRSHVMVKTSGSPAQRMVLRL